MFKLISLLAIFHSPLPCQAAQDMLQLSKPGISSRQKLITQDELALQHQIILERDRDIKKICHDVAEINEMMHTLAEMVHDQGSIIDNIESNITIASDNVKKGVVELKKAEEHQKKGICTIF